MLLARREQVQPVAGCSAMELHTQTGEERKVCTDLHRDMQTRGKEPTPAPAPSAWQVKLPLQSGHGDVHPRCSAQMGPCGAGPPLPPQTQKPQLPVSNHRQPVRFASLVRKEDFLLHCLNKIPNLVCFEKGLPKNQNFL